MQKLLTLCGLLLSVSLAAGCVTTTPGLGEESGNETLAGLTLLDSEEEECDGTLQLGGATLEDEGEGLQEELFVEPGSNASFELEDEDEAIEWACAGEDSSDVESLTCPDGATHVRITRAASGGEVLIECYG